MNSETEIVGLGEVLMDIFEDGTATLGGAPLNVAVHANHLLTACGIGRGTVVSAVGDDKWGESVHSTLERLSMSQDYITLKDKPTGSSLVFEKKDEVEFEISKDVAWDFLTSSTATNDLSRRCSAVAFGSLAQRSHQSRLMIQGFVEQVPGIRLYDVNLRRNTTNGEAGYTRSIIESSCFLASFVKMNLNELIEIETILDLDSSGTFGDSKAWTLMEQLLDRFLLEGVIVTRGKDGSLFRSANEKIRMPASDALPREVHPVGAGDAFSAGMLFGLSQGWHISLCLQLAEKMGAWIVQHISATATLSPEIVDFAKTNLALSSRTTSIK